jgi:hypothetical protein
MRLILPLVLAIIAIAAFALSLKAIDDASKEATALRSQLEIDETTIKALVSHLATVESQIPKSSVTAVAEDDAKLKELSHTDVQAEMQSMRGNRGGGGQRRPQMDAAAFAKMLQDQVGLEEAKATQVAPLLEAMMTDMRQVFANGGTQDEMAAKRKDLRTALEAKTSTMLSADEQTKFVTWLDEREQMFNRGGRRGNNPPANAPQPRAEAPTTATTNAPGATAPGQAPAAGGKPSSF